MSTHWGSCSAEGCPQLTTVPSTTTLFDPAGVMVRGWTEAGGHKRPWRFLGGTEGICEGCYQPYTFHGGGAGRAARGL